MHPAIAARCVSGRVEDRLHLPVVPDGSRMLTTKDIEDDQAAPRNPTVVVNWFDELEAKVPAAK